MQHAAMPKPPARRRRPSTSSTSKRLGQQHDAIVNIATSIPTGVSAARSSAWKPNDRLRTEAAANLAAAASASGTRYVGESITFPYVDGADAWIDETAERTFFSGNASTADAEQAAMSVVGAGVALRFALFFADDSAQVEMFRSMARRGVFGLTGPADAFISWVHVDDAARAVVAALDAPAGIYNVAEPSPARRDEHAVALAAAVGRRRLRRIPAPVVRLGGAALASLSRSHRVSSTALVDATGWEPRVSVVDAWS